MATVQYVAKVKDSRLLELPEEAQELGLKPGDEVTVSVEHPAGEQTPVFPPNEKGLAAMREIAERQKGMRHTDGSDSLRLLREARSGAMYGYEPIDE